MAALRGVSRRILVTGACGQIGQLLVMHLQNKYGVPNVLATDVVMREAIWPKCTLQEPLDVLDSKAVDKLAVSFKPDRVYHMASMLSAKSEENPLKALKINIGGLQNILESARNYEFSVYCASTIAAYGPTSPKIVSNLDIMRPTSMYGITKIHMELLGEYYHRRYGVDFRCSRIPVVNSVDPAGGGSAAFTVNMFYDLFNTGKTVIPVSEDARFPLIYLPDLIRSLDGIMEAPYQRITARCYTLMSYGVTAGEYIREVQKLFPGSEIIVQPDFRDAVVRTWPSGTDGSMARRDWNHRLLFSFGDMVKDMHARIGERLGRYEKKK